jgi:glycosyltransferase involved in cell wall biosynthesis
MKILFVPPTPPMDRSYGAAVRSNNMWRSLQSLGEVDTLVLIAGDEPKSLPADKEHELARIQFLKPMLPWSTPRSRAIQALVSNALQGRHYDLAVIRFLYTAMFAAPSISADIVVDCDDLFKTLPTIGQSLKTRILGNVKLRGRDLVTRYLLSRYDHVWYVNPKDMQRCPVRSGSLLPNVVDIPPPSAANPTSPPTILMVGTFGYGPNREGANYFIDEALPAIQAAIPDVRLRLVGYCPEQYVGPWQNRKGIEAAGFVDDLAKEYEVASVVIAPIFSGGGTEIKVLEGLAYGKGLVVSEFALAGFQPRIAAGTHVEVATRPQDWAERCLSLIRDPARAAALGKAGREMVREEYSFERMKRDIRATIQPRWGSATSDHAQAAPGSNLAPALD